MEYPLATPGARARRSHLSDQAFRAAAASAAAALLVVLALMLFKLGQASAPAWTAKGKELVTGSRWAPGRGHFGALPFVYGTLVTSAIALVLAVPVGIGTALYVSELAPRRVKNIVASLVDLLAAVPSVIYGLWGVLVLVPTLRPYERWLAVHLGGVIPIFSKPSNVGVDQIGFGYL